MTGNNRRCREEHSLYFSYHAELKELAA